MFLSFFAGFAPPCILFVKLTLSDHFYSELALSHPNTAIEIHVNLFQIQPMYQDDKRIDKDDQ